MKKKKRITRRCPFCWSNPYEYKTKKGLLRHICNNHLLDENENWIYPPYERARYLTKQTEKGWKTIPITGLKEVETWLNEYWEGRLDPGKKRSKIWRYLND